MSISDLSNKFNAGAGSIIKIINGETYKQCIRPADIKNTMKNRRRWYYRNLSLPTNLTSKQENIIIGSLLGDGWLSKSDEKHLNCRFCKKQTITAYEHLNWIKQELAPFPGSLRKIYKNKIFSYENGKTFYKDTPKTHKQWTYSSCCHKIFTKLRDKWYKNNIKTIPKDIILNDQILSIWFIDDGCNRYSKRSADIYTCGFTIEENLFLIERLEKDCNILPKLNIRKSRETNNINPYLSIYGSSYDTLMDRIYPYVIWADFLYKTKHMKLTNGK